MNYTVEIWDREIPRGNKFLRADIVDRSTAVHQYVALKDDNLDDLLSRIVLAMGRRETDKTQKRKGSQKDCGTWRRRKCYLPDGRPIESIAGLGARFTNPNPK